MPPPRLAKDEAQRKAINTTVTLSPEEGFATLKEAQHMYDAQVKKRVAEGFKFSFRIDVFSPKGYEWVELS